ncbi:MAG: tetratricopeptide repeat protein [Myxococcota bacterium]
MSSDSGSSGVPDSTTSARKDEESLITARYDEEPIDSAAPFATRAKLGRRTSDALAPRRIGRYILLEPLGRGRMSTVYAGYDEQLDRKLAIKLLRDDGWPNEDAQQRLQQQAQTMAKLSHPNVLTVHEVGRDEEVMFLAMEFVRGETLVQWLQTPRAWTDVVDVFVQAGRGLQAAHEAGIVHHDLTPRNIMLREDGVAKVLDFRLPGATNEAEGEQMGPAPAASGPKLTASSTLVETGIDPPSHRAPEQLEGRVGDARSDQFSFCVALYEALYGEHPHEGDSIEARLASANRNDIRRPTPGNTVPAAVHRVVLRGLQFDPEQRWPSMKALLEPLSRQLTPRRRRWLGPAAVFGAVGVFAAVRWSSRALWDPTCTGSRDRVQEAWDEARAQRVRDAMLATDLPYAAETWARVEPRLDAYAEAWIQTHRDACEATAVRREQSEHQRDLRMACLSSRHRHLRTIVDELQNADAPLVEQAVAAVAQLPRISRCSDLPALEAEVPPPDDPAQAQQVTALRERLVESRAKYSAGKFDAARTITEEVVQQADDLGYEPLIARALAQRAQHSTNAAEFEIAVGQSRQAYDLAAQNGLADIAASTASLLVRIYSFGLNEDDEAAAWLSQADPWSRAADNDDIRTLYLRRKGYMSVRQAEYANADEAYASALALQERTRGPDHPSTAQILNERARVQSHLGRPDDAQQSLERALEIIKKAYGPDHPEVAGALHEMAMIARRHRKLDEARRRAEQAVAIHQRAYGAEHPDTATMLKTLGTILEFQGELDAARDAYERALAVFVANKAGDDPSIAGTLTDLGILSNTQGRYEEARRFLEEARDIHIGAFGPDHPEVANVLNVLGNVADYQGRFDDARELFERSLQILEDKLGPDHVDLIIPLNNLGIALHAQGELTQGREILERVLELQLAHEAPDHPRVGATTVNLAAIAFDQGDLAQSRTWAERSLAVKEKAWGPDHPALGSTLDLLGRLELREQRPERARALLTRALAIRDDKLGAEHPEQFDTLLLLGQTHLAERKPAAALVPLRRARALASTITTMKAGPRGELRFALAQALWAAPEASGRDRPRAQSLARQAREDLASATHVGIVQTQVAQVDDWLLRHR